MRVTASPNRPWAESVNRNKITLTGLIDYTQTDGECYTEFLGPVPKSLAGFPSR